MTPSLLAATEFPSPAEPPVAYVSQIVHAEPPVTLREHKDARKLEILGTADAASASSSTEVCVEFLNKSAISFEDGRRWLVHSFCMRHILIHRS